MVQSSENRQTSAFNTDGHGDITPQLSRGGPDVGGASGVPAPGVPAPGVPGVPAWGGVGLSVRGPRGPSAGSRSMEGGLSARDPRGPRSSSSRGPSGPSGRDPSSRGLRGSNSKGPSTGTLATPVAGPLWVAGGGSAPSLWTFLLTLVRLTVRGGSYQVFSCFSLSPYQTVVPVLVRYPRARGYVLTLLIDVYGRGWIRPPSTMGQQLPRRGGPSGHRASPLVQARGPLPTLATPLPSSPAGALGRAPAESWRPVSQALWLEKRPLPISETQHGLWAPSAFPAFCPPATGDPQRPALTSTPSIFSLSRAGSAQITSWLPFPWPVQEPTQTCLTTVRTTMVHSAASAQAPGLESLPKGASCPWITVPSCPGPHPSPGCAHRGDRCGPAPPGVALGPG